MEVQHLQGCKATLELALTQGVQLGDVIRIERQTGGLFNSLFRVFTTAGVFYVKQYLENTTNKIYGNLPDIPAKDRSELARLVQQMAVECNVKSDEPVIPEILFYDADRWTLVMAAAAADGVLIDCLAKGLIPEAFWEKLPVALAKLHAGTYNHSERNNLLANRIFRDFKLALQYDGIAGFLTEDECQILFEAKRLHAASSACVLHGDLNSRNILIDDHRLGVIDFEQSHLGDPAYDLAYILSEIYISLSAHGREAEICPAIGRFLDNYCEEFTAVSRQELEMRITPHLSAQVLYRFWGPSRASWTFYVDEQKRATIIHQARQLLLVNAPVLTALRLSSVAETL